MGRVGCGLREAGKPGYRMDSSKLEKVAKEDLAIGMYVERLDRPWTETRFLFQGFFIRDEGDLDELRRVCEFVFVDPMRRDGADEPDAPPAKPEPATVRIQTPAPPVTRGETAPRYAYQVSAEKEIKAAKNVHEEARTATKIIFSELLQSGRLNVELAKSTVEPMMNSILRNPNALVWLSRMQEHDNYLFKHALNTCIWGLAFARHLGLGVDEIFQIGLGCMLFDVGKTQLPLSLLLKPGELSPEEWEQMKSHVQKGLGMLRDMDGITPRIMDLIRCHHERHDGSGYPNGLEGSTIPTVGKIAGIVDCYDALTSFRPHAGQMPPHEALRQMFAWRGTLFQPEVVEQFMQVVGVFPTGSLIELNTGAVAVVIAQNNARLRPRIAVLLDDDKRKLPYAEVVDLFYDNPWSDAGQFWVDRCLQPGSYGIQPQQLRL